MNMHYEVLNLSLSNHTVEVSTHANEINEDTSGIPE